MNSHNERVKTLTTALSNLGVGAILAGVIAPLATGSHGDPVHILAWTAIGVDLIGVALFELRRLQ